MTRLGRFVLVIAVLALVGTACNDSDVRETDDDRRRAEELIAADERAAAVESDDFVPEDGDPPSDVAAESGQNDTAADEDETSGSTTTTMRTDGVDPPNDQTDSNGDLRVGEDSNPGGDMVGVRHELGDAGQQCFVIDVVADGEDTSKGPDSYRVLIQFEAPDGNVFLVTVNYDLKPPGAKLRSSDEGRPEIEGTLVTAVWDDSDTLRVCVDGGETSVEVKSFRVQTDVFSKGQRSWVDSALGLAG